MCFSKKKKAAKMAAAAQAKKVEAAPAKKVEPKKTAAKKPAAKPAAKKAVKKPAPKAEPTTKMYHVAKRASDNKWTIKFESGKKVIKTFDTKDKALAYAEQLSANQDGGIKFHASKGAHAGKIQKK